MLIFFVLWGSIVFLVWVFEVVNKNVSEFVWIYYFIRFFFWMLNGWLMVCFVILCLFVVKSN